MEKPLVIMKNWTLSFNIDDILRGQGTDAELVRTGKPRLLKAAERAFKEGTSLLHPTAMLREFAVREHRHERILLEGGSQLTGSLVKRHLGGAMQVVPVVCTIGSKLEQAVTDLLDHDPLYALALDGLGNAAVENLAQQVCGKIADSAKKEGLNASTPLSPGIPEWPVEIGQPQILALLDASRAGIELTSGGMMIPKKSSSFIVGIGTEMAQTDLCALCSMKETCRYQHD